MKRTTPGYWLTKCAKLTLLIYTAGMVAASSARAENLPTGEGADLAIGGPGSGPGQFLELRHITFNAAGDLYALDGIRMNSKTRQLAGNLRVQRFSNDGKLLGAIDLREASGDASAARQGSSMGPQRLAVTASGDVYVTFPDSGKVCRFGGDGHLTRTYKIPRAMAIAIWKGAAGRGPERVAVIASRREVVAKAGWTWLDGDKILILDPAGSGATGANSSGVETTIPLGRSLQNVEDLTTDRAGNFYIQAEPNAVYAFSPDGKLLRMMGGNPTARTEDGSELLHTVAVDSAGNVYSATWGNPAPVTRFDIDGKTVTQRAGQFKFADPWNSETLAIDPSDRLWAAVTVVHDPAGPNFKRYHATPVILRTKADFYQNPPGSIHVIPVRMLGFHATVTCGLPYNVSYEPGKAVPLQFTVAAANRNVSAVAVSWRAFDAMKNEVAAGKFDLSLENGKEAISDFAFTPPRYGSYFVLAQVASPAGSLGGIGEHVGVTPQYPGMQTLVPGQSKGGWVDPPRQVWAGLPSVRIHPGKQEKDLAKTDEEIAAAEASGVTFIVQLVDDVKRLTPEFVREIATRYKGRVAYYEVCNEPNYTANADEYFKAHQMAYKIIKEVDPQAKVMGPATVNMNLEWYRRIYDLGFKDVSDAFSTHDYEGHESITPEHWIWKFAQLRQIMAAHGDAAKPVWQTERAIAGVRGPGFQGLVQAIRCTLHVDLLETLGVPPEHNFHYYLNEGGYKSVPSYLWSKNGPHPGALALRTRHALTNGMGRSYSGMLDFGRIGNTILMGLRYAAGDGQTLVLRNLGTRPMPLDFAVTGTEAVQVADAWGNTRTVQIEGGHVRLSLEQLPTYLLLKPGQEVVAPKLDFGSNVASQAKWEYSAAVEKGDLGLLTNGIYETYHDGDPNGGTNGANIFTGDLPVGPNGDMPPQLLTATFDRPQKIDEVIVRGVRADNGFCALLEYDLEYFDGHDWKTLEQVRNAMPPSEEARTADSKYAFWMDDTNFYVHPFAPVEARGIRIRVLRVSHGLVPDDRAGASANRIAFKLHLREIEIFSAPAGAR